MTDNLALLTELRERCAFYERTNAEQAAILNRVIAERDEFKERMQRLIRTNLDSTKELAALRLKCDDAIAACASETCAMAKKVAAVTAERDDYRAALSKAYQYAAPNAWDQRAAIIIREALAKHSPEDDLEQARRLV